MNRVPSFYAAAATVVLVTLVALAVAAAPAPVPADADALTCGATVPIEQMSAGELDRWMEETGVAPISRATAGGTTDPPLCPDRRSCDPCDQGNGPCFLTPFGSDTCCTSPTGPCFQCPAGTTIQVSSCPCFGELAERRGERCPLRDQDWFCG